MSARRDEITGLLDRARNSADFREGLQLRLLVLLGLETGILSGDGTFTDEDAQRSLDRRDPMIGGRPVHQYMGLSRKDLRASGLDDKAIRELSGYIDIPDETPDQISPLAAPDPGSATVAHPDADEAAAAAAEAARRAEMQAEADRQETARIEAERLQRAEEEAAAAAREAEEAARAAKEKEEADAAKATADAHDEAAKSAGQTASGAEKAATAAAKKAAGK